MAADPTRLGTLLGELKAATEALPAAITEHIVGLRDATLSAARAEVDALRARLADAETRAERAEAAADESGDVAEAAERALETALADADRLRIALASAEDEITRLRQVGSRPGSARDAVPEPPRPPRARSAAPARTPTRPASDPPSPAAETAATPTVATAEAGPSARIAEAFRAWCAETTPVTGKVEFFAGHIRSALPGASVAAIYRDANSQATPVALSTQGAASPVEHWLVALDGRHWLLPQPMAAAQFRELAPCFEGTATPATLVTVAPAEVRVVGDRYEVPTPGRVG